MISHLRRPAEAGWRRAFQDMALGYGLALLALFALPLALLPLVKARDACTVWQPVHSWSGDSYVLRVVASDQASLYAMGGAGGFYLSLDGGQAWSRPSIPLPSGRLEMVRVLDLAVHPQDPRRAQIVVASSADRPRPMVYSTQSGGQSWRVESALGPLRVQAISYGPAGDDLYIVTLGNIYRIDWASDLSLVTGRDADLDRFRIASLGVDEQVQALTVGAWQPDMLTDGERAPRYLYLGIKGRGLRVLLDDSDAGVSLLPVKQADASSVYVREHATVHAICVHPNRPKTVCVGTDKGLYASVDGGTTWIPMAYSLRQRGVLALLVDPADNVIYAGIARGGILYSADDGATWEQLGEGLGHRSVSSLAIRHNGSQGKLLYAATNDGLWQIELPTAG
ncbi:MAG: hypothetical protein JXA74_12035 [Anaerolineae bacterium]|nr:hypothetical protein [Anaerolineae bacterium]